MPTVLKETAEKLRLSLVDSGLTSPFDEAAYLRAFATMVQAGAEAVYVGGQYENWTARRAIVELALQHHLATIWAFGPESSADLGCLITYSPDREDQFRHAAQQIAEILKGANRGDIPFYQARKFNLVINLKTAKALGIEIPINFLAQADEVIE